MTSSEDTVADVLAVASGVWHGPGQLVAPWAFSGSVGGVSSPPFAGANLSESVGDDYQAVESNRRSATALVMSVARTAAPSAPGIPSGDLPISAAEVPAAGQSSTPEPWRAVVMRAEHGSNVAVVGVQDRGSTIERVDGLVTSEVDVPLMALAADCVPLVLADLVSGVVGAAHCGWRGAHRGIVPALVRTMVSIGAEPARCRAMIGPSICGDCYEVGDDVASLFDARYPRAIASTPGRTSLDVAAVVRDQLVEGGVGQVDQVHQCTAESDQLFSYRRDGVTGRQGGLIALRRASPSGEDVLGRADLASGGDLAEVPRA